MPGLASYGAYLPIYRLSRKELGRAWSKPAAEGEKAVANVDEDSITLAVEAGTDCLRGIPRDSIDALLFATTTPPYQEKQSASIIAAALDLKVNILTVDVGHSLRGGSLALRLALDIVSAGSARHVLVIASDTRIGAPGSESESAFGDAAAAVLVANDQTVARVEGSSSITSAFLDVWRNEEDRYPETWESRFVFTHGYQEVLSSAVSDFLKQKGLSPKEFTRAAFYGPNARSHNDLARALGFDLTTQIQDPLLSTVGNAGAASSLLMLVAMLEGAKVGDRVLLGSYGDGADVYSIVVEQGIRRVQGSHRGVKGYLASKMALPTYEKYLRFRKLLDEEVPRRPPERSALTVSWRDRSQIMALRGAKCRQCGTVQYPMQHLCTSCLAKGDFDEVRLSDKTGVLFTYSKDEIAPVIESPQVAGIVDLDGGGRFYTEITDRDPSEIEIGQSMEMTFRRVHDGMGVHNYYWKARSVRGA